MPALSHGHTANGVKSPTYESWRGMVQRCSTPTNVRWSEYGGRGIGVCVSWARFVNFLADMGERPEGTTLDRIDVDDDYAPSNCRWATPQEQTRNSRRYLAGECKQGHEFTPENTYVDKRGWRHCRTCKRRCDTARRMRRRG